MAAFEVVNGLYAVAEVLEDHMVILDEREFPDVPVTVRIGVATSGAVRAFADAVSVPVVVDEAEDGVYTRVTVVRGLIELVVYHIGEPVRELSRPASVTEHLAEVEG